MKANNRPPKLEDSEYEPKTVDIPEDFKKIAKKFGLPEDHIDFFYEHRKSFNWEYKDKTEVHCTERSCKFTTKQRHKCLSDHMISVHNYNQTPCDHVDCSFIAYSQKHLNLHKSRFHGHGQKPTEYGTHSCPFPSCKNSFRYPSHLRRHVNVHRNILFSCKYCPYTAAETDHLHENLSLHFNIKKFICDVCSRAFNTRSHLNTHIRALHSNEDYECVDCEFLAKSLRSLQKHRITCEKRLKYSRIL